MGEAQFAIAAHRVSLDLTNGAIKFPAHFLPFDLAQGKLSPEWAGEDSWTTL